MSPSLRALVWFATWTLVLAFVMVNHRVYFVLTGQRKINSFTPDGAAVSAFQARACRAHANCYENLPVFAALILAAVSSGKGAITDPLAMIAVYARMIQSTVHLDRKSTRLNSSHGSISYAVFCLKKKNKTPHPSDKPAAPGDETSHHTGRRRRPTGHRTRARRLFPHGTPPAAARRNLAQPIYDSP